MYFSSLCYLNEKEICGENIPSTSAPWLSLPPRLTQVDLCCIHFLVVFFFFFLVFGWFLMCSGGVCMPFLYISIYRSVQHVSVCYLLLQRTTQIRNVSHTFTKSWNNKRQVKEGGAVGFAYHCSKMLHFGLLLLDHHIKLMEVEKRTCCDWDKTSKGIRSKKGQKNSLVYEILTPLTKGVHVYI